MEVCFDSYSNGLLASKMDFLLLSWGNGDTIQRHLSSQLIELGWMYIRSLLSVGADGTARVSRLQKSEWRGKYSLTKIAKAQCFNVAFCILCFWCFLFLIWNRRRSFNLCLSQWSQCTNVWEIPAGRDGKQCKHLALLQLISCCYCCCGLWNRMAAVRVAHWDDLTVRGALLMFLWVINLGRFLAVSNGAGTTCSSSSWSSIG